MKKKLVCLMLSLAMTATVLTGCGKNTASAKIDYSTLEPLSDQASNEIGNGYSDFAFSLLTKLDKENGNVLVSPLSVAIALDMLAQGANGDTYDEIAALLGVSATKEEFARFYSEYVARLSEDSGMHVANSLWVDQNHLDNYQTTLNADFQNALENYFGIDSKIEKFDSVKTADKVNKWVEKNTDGMIDRVINDIKPETFALIVNTVAFDKNWEEPFKYEDTNENGIFTNSLGNEETIKMMSHTEYSYYENELATGFMKEYEGGQYGFLAILPKDETYSLGEFLGEFNGECYRDFCASSTNEEVRIKMPAFSYDYEEELKNVLSDMGMKKAFDPASADFSGMVESGEALMYASSVIHKTHIEVDELGTKAAAATVIAMTDGIAMMDEKEPKYVNLNRPFAYAIVDLESGNPLFIGTVNTVK